MFNNIAVTGDFEDSMILFFPPALLLLEANEFTLNEETGFTEK